MSWKAATCSCRPDNETTLCRDLQSRAGFDTNLLDAFFQVVDVATAAHSKRRVLGRSPGRFQPLAPPLRSLRPAGGLLFVAHRCVAVRVTLSATTPGSECQTARSGDLHVCPARLRRLPGISAYCSSGAGWLWLPTNWWRQKPAGASAHLRVRHGTHWWGLDSVQYPLLHVRAGLRHLRCRDSVPLSWAAAFNRLGLLAFIEALIFIAILWSPWPTPGARRPW